LRARKGQGGTVGRGQGGSLNEDHARVGETKNRPREGSLGNAPYLMDGKFPSPLRRRGVKQVWKAAAKADAVRLSDLACLSRTSDLLTCREEFEEGLVAQALEQPPKG
jgi:hypothetical protein